MNKATRGIAVTVVTIGLIAPTGVATAKPSTPPPGACVVEARQERQQAHKEFRVALRDARQDYRAATSDERATRRAAIKEADTKPERVEARKAFREATAQDRKDRRGAIREAKELRRDAQRTFVATVKDCRS